MFNLNFSILNNTIFLTLFIYLTIVFTPLYDLISISETGIYFLYFILGYLVYYIISILKLINIDIFTAKNSFYVMFLKNLSFSKISVLKKMQNFYLINFAFIEFFSNFCLIIFFLMFLKNQLKKSIELNFLFYFICSEIMTFEIEENLFFFEQSLFFKIICD